MALPNPIDVLNAALPVGFAIDDFLDRGGQAAVFRGRHNGQPAAIKIFSPAADQRRVDREIAALQTINCDYLVKVLAATTVTLPPHVLPVIAYEFLEGGDLRNLLPPAPPPDFVLVRDIAVHVSTAVDVLWASRIVHRDIKPANIIRSGNRSVLADVGLARHVDLPALTILGGLVGTAGYMSPEQAVGRRSLTVLADVFSLGVTLYEIASGIHPFNRAQANIGSVTPAPLGSHRPDLPAEFCDVVHSMLNPAAYQRPTSVTDAFARL